MMKALKISGHLIAAGCHRNTERLDVLIPIDFNSTMHKNSK